MKENPTTIWSSLFVLIVEHDNGVTRYFGPFDSSEKALQVGGYFGYDNTPYHVSVTEMIVPFSPNYVSTIRNMRLH